MLARSMIPRPEPPRLRRVVATGQWARLRLLLLGAILFCALANLSPATEFRVATFEADITIPIGHACMGGGVADAKEIVDPLFAKGFVLIGTGEPIVVVALDWCQVNNDSYDA